MNKVIFPTMLIATALIAGAFAFMPIEEATAVHTTIQNSQLREAGTVVIGQFDNDLSVGTQTITSTADFVVSCVISDPTAGAIALITVTDTVATSGAFDILASSSVSFTRAQDANTILSITSSQANDSLCSAMTLESGAISYVGEA